MCYRNYFLLLFLSSQRTESWCSGPDSGVGDLLFSFMKRGSALRTISVGRRCAVVRVAKAPAPLFMILRVWIGRPLN